MKKIFYRSVQLILICLLFIPFSVSANCGSDASGSICLPDNSIIDSSTSQFDLDIKMNGYDDPDGDPDVDYSTMQLLLQINQNQGNSLDTFISNISIPAGHQFSYFECQNSSPADLADSCVTLFIQQENTSDKEFTNGEFPITLDITNFSSVGSIDVTLQTFQFSGGPLGNVTLPASNVSGTLTFQYAQSLPTVGIRFALDDTTNVKTINEPDGSIEVEVFLVNGPISTDLDVDLEFFINNSNFTAFSTIPASLENLPLLTISSGDISQVFTIDAEDDSQDNLDDLLEIYIKENPSSYSISNDNDRVDIDIIDDDVITGSDPVCIDLLKLLNINALFSVVDDWWTANAFTSFAGLFNFMDINSGNPAHSTILPVNIEPYLISCDEPNYVEWADVFNSSRLFLPNP